MICFKSGKKNNNNSIITKEKNCLLCFSDKHFALKNLIFSKFAGDAHKEFTT